jgi:anti-sigma factor RsiW
MTSRVPVACDARKDDLAALALGELPGDRAAALRTHLETCPGCRTYHAGMARTLGAVRALPQPEPSAALTARILAAARQGRRTTIVPTAGPVARWLEWLADAFRRPLVASAAVAVVAASAAVALLLLGREDAPAPGAPAAGPQLARFEAQAAAPAAPVALRPPVAAPALSQDAERPSGAATPRGPYPVVPEAVEPAPMAGLLAEERPNAEQQAVLEAEPSRETAAGAASTTGVRGAVPGADRNGGSARGGTPLPNETEDGVDSGRRFTEGRELPAADGDILVAGQPPPAEPDNAWVARDEPQRADDWRVVGGTTTVPVVTAGVRNGGEPAANGNRSVGGGGTPAVATPPSPPPPPPPTVTLGVSAPAQGPAPQAAPDPADAVTESVAMFAAPPADRPAYPLEEGYAGMTSGDESAGAAEYRAPSPGGAADSVTVARRQLADGDAAEAEALLEQAMREETARAADVTFLLAETYARQGKWSDAARTYELFLARYLDDPRANEARWRAADAYRRSGNDTRSASLLQQLVGASGYTERARAALDELSTRQAEAAGQSATGEAPAEAVAAPASVEPASPP